MNHDQLAWAVVVINMVSSVVILFRGVFYVANTMTKHTFFPIRLAWILMPTGALGTLLGPLFGFVVVSVPLTLALLGVAIFVCFERRACEVKS